MKNRKILALILAFSMMLSLVACTSSAPQVEDELPEIVNTNPCEFTVDDAQKEMFKGLTRIDENGALYSLDYTYDYKLDDALNANIGNIMDLLTYADGTLISDVSFILQALAPQCSSFTVNDGDTFYFGRNFDSTTKDTAGLLIRTTPKDGYESISMADITSLGLGLAKPDNGESDISLVALAPYLVVDGMNEKGVCVSAMVLDEDPATQDTGKNKIMTTIAMRLILDRAASTDEAVELLSQYDMQSPNPPRDFHFLVGDASGNTKLIEYVNNEMVVLDHNYSTNFYVAPEMYGKGHGQDRYDKLEAALGADDVSMSGDEAEALLESIAQNGESANHSYTVWSMLYNLTDREVDIVVERDYSKIYTYKLGSGWDLD